MAEGLGIEPSLTVLETIALADILTLSIVFVCPKCQASFRFVKKGGVLRRKHFGRGDRTRTGTVLLPTDFKSVAATYYATPP